MNLMFWFYLQHYLATDTVEFGNLQSADAVMITIVDKQDDDVPIFLEIDIIACSECELHHFFLFYEAQERFSTCSGVGVMTSVAYIGEYSTSSSVNLIIKEFQDLIFIFFINISIA